MCARMQNTHACFPQVVSTFKRFNVTLQRFNPIAASQRTVLNFSGSGTLLPTVPIDISAFLKVGVWSILHVPGASERAS